MGGFEIIAIRMFTAIPGHFIDGVCMGYFFNLGLVKKKQKLNFNNFIPLALICPVILHGSYDYFISISFEAGILTLLISILLNYYPLKEFLTQK